MSQTTHAGPSRDWARQPLFALLWWGLPLAIAEGSNVLRLSLRDAAWIWSGAMAVMGFGCLLNAARCRRLHCFVSAPALLLGAAAAAVIGFYDPWGPFALEYITWAVLGFVLLSFIPEALGWRYV